MDRSVGLDFGTTNSAVGVAADGGVKLARFPHRNQEDQQRSERRVPQRVRALHQDEVARGGEQERERRAGCGRKISIRSRQAPMTMQLSATLKSGQW